MKMRQISMLLATTAAVVVACGSEPKKEPSTATPTATASAPAAPVETAAATASVTPAPTAAPADAGKSDKQTECEGLVTSANETLDAERIAVDKLCKKDADCMPIKGRACAFNCVNAAIPKAEEKDWNEALTKAKDGPCKKWTENECSKVNTKPAPTCKDKKVWCDKGHCAVKDK
jgi:hypothetical protein